MQTNTTSQKQVQQPANSGKRQIDNAIAAKKPTVRITDIKKMMQKVLTDPDSVSHDEFLSFQSAVGYRKAIGLMEEGRRRKRIDKGEQQKSVASAADTKGQQYPKAAESKQNRTDIKPKNEEIHSEQVKKETTSGVEVQKIESTQKSNPKPTVNETNKSVQNDKAKEKNISELNEQLKTITKGETQDTLRNIAAAPQKEDTKNKGSESAAANNTKAQAESQQIKPGDIAGIGKTNKEAVKAPEVKIKQGDPGSILEQLGNVPPTQALNAYSQASAISGEAMEKQKEKTQKKIPNIPAPTGLASVKNNSKAKKKPAAIKHSAPSAFKSQKTGGKAQVGMPADFSVSSGEITDPEEIMDETRKFSASTPKINMSGEADPSQAEGFKSEAGQSIKTAKKEELHQTAMDFGENGIYPQEDHTILKAKHQLKAKTLQTHKSKNTLDIPAEMEGQLNKTLGPSFKKQIGEQKDKYGKGKGKFDTDVAAAKASSEKQIGQLKTDTKKKQVSEQIAAKAEVKRLRAQWKDEINDTVSEYDRDAEKETRAKTREISNVKEEKEKEIKSNMAKAEKDAHQEYKSAKKKADDKKKDGEKEAKPWYAKVGDWVKDKAAKLVEGIKKAVNFIFDGLRKAVKAIFARVKAVVTGLIEQGRRLIVGIIKGLGAVLKVLVKKVFAKFPAIANKFCGLIDKAVDKATAIVNKAADMLKKGVSAVLDSLSNALDKSLGFIQSLYNKAFALIGVIAGKLADIMKGIAELGKAAKASPAHIEGALWKQLLGIDVSQPLEQEDTAAPKNEVNETLTDKDIEVDHIEYGDASPELANDMNMKDGETREIQGSSDPHTMESIEAEFNTDKAADKSANSFVEGTKVQSVDRGKILDQIKEFVVKWFKDNWLKLLAGILGVLAGIVVLEIVTGGAITAALPVIMDVIVNLMNISAAISAIDTIAQATKYIATYLTQGWIGKTTVAAIALAMALAIGLIELAMALGFKALGAGFKAAGKGIKRGAKAVTKGVKSLAKVAGRGMKSLLKSGKTLVSKTGRMIIKNGKLIIKGLPEGFAKGASKFRGLLDKLLSRFKFKKFKIERKGINTRISGWIDKIKEKLAAVFKRGSKDSKAGERTAAKGVREAFNSNEEAFTYYKDLVEKLDVSTAKNQATFYSGPGNRQLAEQFAKANGKMTLELTPGGKYLDGLKLFEEGSPLTGPQAAEVWSRLSQRYAQQASGNAYGFVQGARPGSIFNTVEYPALQNNKNIINVFTELFK